MSDQLSPSNPPNPPPNPEVQWTLATTSTNPLGSTLTHFTDQVHALKSHNEGLQGQNEKLQKQNQTYKGRIQQLEYELKVNTDLLEAAKHEIETVWKKKVDDLIQHNESLTREQQILKDRIVELETQNDQLLQNIQKLQTKIDQQEHRILTLEREKSIADSKLILFEFMDLLDRHFIREIYGPQYVGLMHLNDLLKENLDGKLDPDRKTRFQKLCTKLDLRSTVLSTTRDVHETIRSFKNVRHHSVHDQHQIDRDITSLYQMSDQLCDHLGGDIESWKLRGRALIALTFKALGNKPFEQDRKLSVSAKPEPEL